MSTRCFILIASVFVWLMLVSTGLAQPLTQSEYDAWKLQQLDMSDRDTRDCEVYYKQNQFVKVGVCVTDGKLVIGTADDRRLLYGFPDTPYTSQTNIKIDDTVYTQRQNFGVLMQPWDFQIVDNTLQTTWQLDNVQIKQILEPVDLVTRGAISVSYQMVNNDAVAHDVGSLLLFDTMIDNNDGAPIADGTNYSRLTRQFEGDDVPSFWQAYQFYIENPNFPGLIGEGTLSGAGAVLPDRFAIGNWGSFFNVLWDYTPPDTATNYVDSAVLMWWNPVTLPPGESVTFKTLFGTGDVAFNPGQLILSVSAPGALQNVDCELSPNPFDVNVIVNNNSDTAALNVEATLNLPPGLSLTPGQEATQSVSAFMEPTENQSVSWEVVADNVPQDTTLIYNVTVNSSNTESNSVNRAISIPTLRPQVDLETNVHDFGDVPYGEQATWQMPVHNIGNEPLLITDISINQPEFALDGVTLPLEIEACSATDIPVTFAPSQSGAVQAVLIIEDQFGEQTGVLLQGEGTMPDLHIAATELNFGAVNVGQSLDWPLEVFNNGTAPLHLTELAITPTPPFSVMSPDNLPQTLDPQEGLDIIVRFAPLEYGTFSGTLTVTSNDPVDPVIPVSLNGQGVAPVLEFSEVEYQFGLVDVGSTAIWPVTVYNTSPDMRALVSIESPLPQFTIETDWSFPHDIAPGDSAQFEVHFTPDGPQFYNTNITVTNDDPYFPTTSLYVEGRGFAASLVFSDTANDYGELYIGQTDNWSFDISNVSDQTITLDPPFTITTTRDEEFTVVMPEVDEFPIALASGQTQEVVVEFSPTALDSVQGVLTVYSDDVYNPEQPIHLSGFGLGAILELPTSTVDFGPVQVDNLALDTLHVSNTGNFELAIYDIEVAPNYFGYIIGSQLPFIVPAGDSIPLELSFTPPTVGDFSGSLQFTTNDPFQPIRQVALSGSGVEINVAFTTDIIDLGPVRVNNSVVDTVFLTNLGNGTAVVQDILLSSDQFELVAPSDFPLLLDPTDTLPVTIAFQPTTEGLHPDTLRVEIAETDLTPELLLFGFGTLPHVQASATSHSFGPVLVGDSVPWSFSVQNVGTAPLIISEAMVTGANAFSFENDPLLPDTIAVDSSRTYTVQFAPTTVGNFNGAVHMVSDDPDQPETVITLSGLGAAGAEIEIVETAYDFGLIEISQQPAWSFWIYNVGSENLVVQDVTSSNSDFALFIDSPDRTFFVPPGDSVAVEVVFTPSAPGPSATEIHVLSNDLLQDDIQIDVDATVVAADIDLSTTNHDFGNVRVNTTAEWPLIIQNQGTFQLIVETISSTDPHFTIDPLTPIPDIIAPLESRTVWLRFTPAAADQAYAGELLIYSSDYDESPISVALSGNGVAPDVGFSAISHDFGATRIMTTAQWTLTLSNSGSAAVILEGVTISQPAFAVTTDFPLEILPGQEQDVTVTFTPSEENEYAATLQFQAGVALPQVSLFGQGTVSRIELSEVYHDFGLVENQAEWTVTVSNSGTASLNISAIENSQPQFALVPAPTYPLTVPPQQSLDWAIQFTSAQTEPLVEDTFIFSCDDPETPHPTIFVEASETAVAVELAHFGAYPQPDGVRLEWALAQPEPLAGFQVYRAAVSDPTQAQAVTTSLVVGDRQFGFTDRLLPADEADASMFYYWIQAQYPDGSFGPKLGPVAASPPDRPREIRLFPNQPNPFQAHTEIRYELPAGQSAQSGQKVSVRVYALTGQLVRVLVDETQAAGIHRVTWDGRDERGVAVAGGLYFYRLSTATQHITRRMILMR